MKKNRIITGALLALLVTGCSDDMEVSRVLPVSGDEILFGAETTDIPEASKYYGPTSDAASTTPGVRTIYQLPEGETSFSSYSALEIKWVPGEDSVRVYCPEASPECKSADYVVQNNTTSGDYLVKTGEVGLRWNDTSWQHDFYAFYPLGRIKSGLQDGTVVSAHIPVAQEHGKLVTMKDNPQITDPNWKIIMPDMSYCMMAGRGTWEPNNDRNVTLNFTPLVSVLDVVVNGPAENEPSRKIVSISVTSKSQDIVGDFTYNVAENTFTFPTNNGDCKIATVNCTQKDEAGNMNPVELAPGEKLNVKFFLLPRDIKAEDLSVSVLLEGNYVLTQTLGGHTGSEPGSNDDVLAAGKISRIITPKLTTAETSNWMSLIGDDVLFSQVSLPGTHQSYTASVSVPDNYDAQTDISQKYQELNVADGTGTQFDAGVRAFDVDIDVNSSGQGYVYSANGRVAGNITLSQVLTALNNKINATDTPTECAVVFLNYVDRDVSKEQWVNAISNLLTKWNNTNGKLIRYTPQTTMGEMRGHIAVIVNLPDGTSAPSNEYFNYIVGYGTSRQNLDIRDLNYNGQYTVHVQNLLQINNPEITSGSPYAYREGLGLVPYFITEVVGRGDHADITDCDLMSRKIDLMDEMLTRIRQDNGQSLFINDLSGFCVVKDINSVGWSQYTTHRSMGTQIVGYWWRENSNPTIYDYEELPGADGYDFYMQAEEPTPTARDQRWLQFKPYDSGSEKSQGGNPALFAERFNARATQAIYNLVQNGRVPMGIVMMNFAGSADVTWGGHTYQVQGVRLPGLVVSNNFLFELKTRDDGSN